MTSFEVNTSTRSTSIDGKDVSQTVTAVDVYMPTDGPAEVQVWVENSGVISGDGIVIVHEPPNEETLNESIRGFLESLDPRAVQAAANQLPSTWSTVPAQQVIQALLGAL